MDRHRTPRHPHGRRALRKTRQSPTGVLRRRRRQGCVPGGEIRRPISRIRILSRGIPSQSQDRHANDTAGFLVGRSRHGRRRGIVRSREISRGQFAMPECKIGLFPDVGGSWWIPRLSGLYDGRSSRGGAVGGVGNYLALTGARLMADDLMYAGIATHYVKSERLGELKRALIESTEIDGVGDCVAGVLMSFHDRSIDVDASFLSRNRDEIDRAFHAKNCVEDIVCALENMESPFATSTLPTLRQMSPTSLKVTLEGLKRGSLLNNIGDCLAMEYRIVQAFMKEGSDFYEGIRAALVDKDGKPKWSPSSLEDVSMDIVESYFQNLGDNELCFEEGETSKL
ncbi:hypothetical protein ACHAWX_003339 [Stephanocyclus meneghinianus]